MAPSCYYCLKMYSCYIPVLHTEAIFFYSFENDTIKFSNKMVMNQDPLDFSVTFYKCCFWTVQFPRVHFQNKTRKNICHMFAGFNLMHKLPKYPGVGGTPDFK